MLVAERARVVRTEIDDEAGCKAAAEVGAGFVHPDVSQEETGTVLVNAVTERKGF